MDSNDTAYNEYLRWKTEGYSGDFKAMVELTAMHTACRQCNLGGDRLRLKRGIAPYDEPLHTFKFGVKSLFSACVVAPAQMSLFFEFGWVRMESPSIYVNEGHIDLHMFS